MVCVPVLTAYSCRGSAFPATLAFQIRELERETEYDIRLDAIVTVIDAENFTGYEDTSPTAKMQASYSDIILIVSDLCAKSSPMTIEHPPSFQNKWEHVNDRALDLVIDHLNTLNDATPKIRCDGRDGVDPNLLFGIDSKLFTNGPADMVAKDHHDEVQTITVLRKASEPLPHGEVHNLEDCPRSGDLQKVDSSLDGMEESLLRSALERLFKEVVWRVKGFVRLRGRLYILNWAFGRYDLTEVHPPDMSDDNVRLTVMGERGEVKKAVREFCRELRAEVA